MSTTAELSSLLLPLLDLLHMPAAALIMLWKNPEIKDRNGKLGFLYGVRWKCHDLNLLSAVFFSAAPLWPPVEQH